jgi:hypothetical protein
MVIQASISLPDHLHQAYQAKEDIYLDCIQEPLMLRGLRTAQATVYNKY